MNEMEIFENEESMGVMSNKLITELQLIINRSISKGDDARSTAENVYGFLVERHRRKVTEYLESMMKHNPVEFQQMLDTSPLSYFFNKIVRMASMNDSNANLLRKSVEQIKQK